MSDGARGLWSGDLESDVFVVYGCMNIWHGLI